MVMSGSIRNTGKWLGGSPPRNINTVIRILNKQADGDDPLTMDVDA